MINKVDWIIEQHRKTNHLYDDYIPYEFHLKLVVKEFNDFKHTLPKDMYVDSSFRGDGDITLRTIELACWGHDLIEDTRVSYNDVATSLGIAAADIIYAVTNEKGKNRKERANDKYYEDIRNTKGAAFVKLCDRIANVKYSILTGSNMYDMYRKENKTFINAIKGEDYLKGLINHLKQQF